MFSQLQVKADLHDTLALALGAEQGLLKHLTRGRLGPWRCRHGRRACIWRNIKYHKHWKKAKTAGAGCSCSCSCSYVSTRLH